MTPIKGNDRRFYLTTSSKASFTWLEGEQSNSFSRSAETIDITDKSGEWSKFIAGRRSATADVSVMLDDSASAAQKDLLESFHDGDTVYCFVGVLSSASAPSEGDFFEAIITSCNDSSDKDGISTRDFSLQVSSEPTHYPAF